MPRHTVVPVSALLFFWGKLRWPLRERDYIPWRECQELIDSLLNTSKKKGGRGSFPLNLQKSNSYVDHSHKLMVKI